MKCLLKLEHEKYRQERSSHSPQLHSIRCMLVSIGVMKYPFTLLTNLPSLLVENMDNEGSSEFYYKKNKTSVTTQILKNVVYI